MLKVLQFLADYWMIPLVVIGGIFSIIWLRSRGKNAKSIVEIVTSELDAIAAQREARDIKLQLGHVQAKQHVLDKYREKLKNLDEQTGARIKELEDDPEALAKALEKLTNS